jgi:hypothetical protein
VVFLMMLRKPRTVMVDAVSRVVRTSRHDAREAKNQNRFPSPRAQISSDFLPGHANMRLRGRDLHGRSYDLVFGNNEFRRHGNRLVIGRNNDICQLVLPHDSVSRQHATLLLVNGSVLLEDRNSGNGTKVNGRDLQVGSSATALQLGDRITMGEVELTFEKIS